MSQPSHADALDWPGSAVSRLISLDGPGDSADAVHYLDFGGPADGSLLVCVHGLGGSALNFGLLGSRLTGQHRFLALDLLAHGRSDAGAAPTLDPQQAVAAQVDLLGRFINAVTDEPVVLVGHSLGGVLAMRYGLEHPDDVARLVLIGPPVPHAGAGRRDRQLAAKLLLLRTPGVGRLVARTMRRSTPEALVDKQLRDATPHAAAIDRAAVAAAVEETRVRAQRADAGIAQRRQWDAILGTIALLAGADEWHRRLDALRVPVLWLHGDDDLLSPQDDAQAFVDRHPSWSVQTRANVGHLPHLEDPAWTSAVISEWLAGPTTR